MPQPKLLKSKGLKPAGSPPLHPFDREYGTDTGGLIPGASLLTGHPNDAHLTAYYAVALSILDGLVDLWLQTRPPSPIEAYTFVDIGAGKGRALLGAARHPFKRAVGVELNPGLAAIARANIRLFEAHESAPALTAIELLEGDALQVPLPDAPVLAFLFHPFEAPVLRRFLLRVQQRYRRRPGSLDLVYVNAEHFSVIDTDSAFERIFFGMVPMSPEDHVADQAEIAGQTEYGSTGDELCAIYRFNGRP